MLRKLLVVAAIGMLPTLALAQPKGDEWDFNLSGSGSADTSFDGNAFAVNFQIGKFLTKDFEVSLRQSVAFADEVAGGSTWNANTTIAADWFFDLDAWRPFIGANIGYSYGDIGQDSWTAGLEAGVRYYVNSSTYVYGIVQYQFLLQESFGDGAWVYGVGIGFIK